jgi:hypothetical protein
MREGPPSSIIVLSILLCIYIVHALLVLRPTVNESRITIVQTGGLWARGHGTRKEVEQPSTKPATRAKELLTPHQQHPHICSSALRQIGHLSRKQYKLMIIVAETSDRKGRAGEHAEAVSRCSSGHDSPAALCLRLSSPSTTNRFY